MSLYYSIITNIAARLAGETPALRLAAFKRRSHERRQLPSIHVFVGGLAHAVVAAGKRNHLVVETVVLEFPHHLSREFGKEREIVFRVNNERFPRPAGELLKV